MTGAAATAGSAAGVPAFAEALSRAQLLAGSPNLDDVATLSAISALVGAHGSLVEAWTLPLLPALLDKAALPVKQDALKTAALATANTIALGASGASIRPVLLPALISSIDVRKKWQTRVAALNLISAVAQLPRLELSIADALEDIVPALFDSMCDARSEVSTAGETAMLQSCLRCGNGDLDKVIPTIVSSMARLAEVPETIHAVSATTFVKAVEKPTLAVLTPLLARGLVERATSVIRMTAVIIENMTKLVMKKEHAAPLIPLLLPGLAKARAEVADPECRGVVTRAFTVLLASAGMDEATAMAAIAAAQATPSSKAADKPRAGAGGKGKAGGKGASAAAAEPAAEPSGPATLASEAAACEPIVRELVAKHVAFAGLATAAAAAGAKGPSGDAAGASFDGILKHVGALAGSLSLNRIYDTDRWVAAVVPFLGAYATDAAATEIAKELRLRVAEKNGGIQTDSYVPEEDDGTPDLCKAEFSLAYGAKTLLNTATLHLKVGKKYGLIGPERCGKSTLLRAIATGQLEGFPTKEEVRTVYVDSTIKAEDADYTVLDFVLADPDVISGGADKETCVSTLVSLGFTDTMRAGVVGRLSGGWRCKLALARAQLSRSAIYLLDEPTNHLDKKNTAWLIEYIKTLTGTTCIMVSHDSAFLDQTCTHIINFEGFKLRTYVGQLSEFVKTHPEAKSYYELSSTAAKFSFPQPGFLEGIKSKDRAILKLGGVSITYPMRELPVLTDVSINISLSSRVVVLGANGAGKSTLIKTVVGELLPIGGSVWRHPNLRIAYVAQDAFHHLQEHLKSTPFEYIQWRYATGEDREAQGQASKKTTEAEEKLMLEAIVINGEKRTINRIVARRKDGKTYEYEVEWVGKTPDKNEWMERDWLVARGWGKAVDACDAREAAAAGLHSRPLTAANIVAHMTAVGLDPEQTMHSRINSLSGGQLIKVVIGAAMWMNPHIIIMDEPTNFLDRDSLGALAAAIKEFEGGVLLITHHHDFTKELCGETWTVGDGKVLTVGQSWDTSIVEKKEDPDEVVDAAGNVIKVNKKVKMTPKERKAYIKEKKARRKRGEDVSSDEEEEAAA